MTDEIGDQLLALGWAKGWPTRSARLLQEPVGEFPSSRSLEVVGWHRTRLYSIDELAAEWGVHRNTIHRLVSSGELRAVRVGTRIRFRPADVAAYLERELN